MPSKKSKKSGSPRKSELNESKHDSIKDKPYTTHEINTSITLLESPENNIVLEALLFLSKYADIQRNNLIFIQSSGVLPKLLALFDHNICILRVSLRLLSQLLALGAARLQLNEDIYDGHVLKICNFYVSHKDIYVKEYSILILEKYILLGKAELTLGEPELIKTILKVVKQPENEVILNASLELLNVLLDIQAVRSVLSMEESFKLDAFAELLAVSEKTYIKILAIFEKITYFCEDPLQAAIKNYKIIELAFSIIVNPERERHLYTCLNIVTHSMRSEVTESCFIQSLEFLTFCQWVKTCPAECMPICARVFLDLAKIDSIRQTLFDISIEDIILSFLRSNEKAVINIVFDAISCMSRHKYCCEKVVTPVVIKKIILVLSTVRDSSEPFNETAINLLYNLCRRDARTLHMIRAYSEFSLLLKYLTLDLDELLECNYRKLLDIVNMFVTNHQLQSFVLCSDMYDIILAQSQNKLDEICMRCLEIMINSLDEESFREHFLSTGGSQIIIDKLATTSNENVIRLITIFLQNALLHDALCRDLIRHKALLVLKGLPESFKYRNPLIERAITLIYNICLPVKFFEKGRLELVDRITERFYIMAGQWTEPFPFLEILELRRMSTRTTIYVVDDCVQDTVPMCRQCYRISQQYGQTLGLPPVTSIASISSAELREFVNYGFLSRDPYLPKYIDRVQELVALVPDVVGKVQVLASFVDGCLCGPHEGGAHEDKLHTFHMHVESLKEKLGTNMIPIGFLRLGFHCERALLFKALADQVLLPATLVAGRGRLYWNEVTLMRPGDRGTVLQMFVVDLVNNVGQLLPLGSRECNTYCDCR